MFYFDFTFDALYPFLLVSYLFPTRFLLVSTRFYSFLLVSYSFPTRFYPFLLVVLFTKRGFMYLLNCRGRWEPGRPHGNFIDNKTHQFQTIFGPSSLARWVSSNLFSTDIRIVLVRCAQWNGLITEVVYFRFYACFICLFAFHPSAKQHVQSRDVEIKNSSRKNGVPGLIKGVVTATGPI